MKQGEKEAKNKSNGGRTSKRKGGSKSKSNGGRNRQSAVRRRRTVGRDASGKRRRAGGDGVDWPRLGQAEEVQASSEGETRGIGRTRPAGEAKERATEGKANMKAKEDLAAEENTKR